MNLEPRSHLLTATYMSRVESLGLLHKDPPRLGKACVGLYRLDLLEYEISYLKGMRTYVLHMISPHGLLVLGRLDDCCFV
jgi:hypothetical protein